MGAFVLGDAMSLASLVATAANAQCGPNHCSILSSTLAKVDPELRTRVAGHLWAWRGPINRDALAPWLDYLNVPQNFCSPEDPAEASVPPEIVATTPAAPTATQHDIPDAKQPLNVPGPGLRGLVQDAPVEFRCALDGQMLVDPVRSPAGYVFERSVLARHLQMSGSLCPMTGVPLTLAECARDVELR